MSPEIVGALVGFCLGLISFVVLQRIAENADTTKQGYVKERPSSLLKYVAWFDLVLLTIVGYFVGPMIIGS